MIDTLTWFLVIAADVVAAIPLALGMRRAFAVEEADRQREARRLRLLAVFAATQVMVVLAACVLHVIREKLRLEAIEARYVQEAVRGGWSPQPATTRLKA